jgi:uncharacterized protein (TIGR03435 family)
MNPGFQAVCPSVLASMGDTLRRTVLGLFLLCLAGVPLITCAGTASAQNADATAARSDASTLPSFEVATIKPMDPNAGGALGFYSRPGGRVFVGAATVKTIVTLAYHLQEYQVVGGPDWASTERYNISAVPPDSSPSRTAVQPEIKASPSEEQRQMLQRLLLDRFGLKVHRETREGPVYILSRGKKPLQLKEPEHKDGDPRGTVIIRQGGIADGSAFGENITMPILAEQLGSRLELPVIDRTGIQGSYDFELAPSDPDNHDFTFAAFQAMDRLGLKLERSRGSSEVIVIDRVDRPSQN